MSDLCATRKGYKSEWLCRSGPSFYPFEDWPAKTVFYADEQKLDSNKRPNLLVRVGEASSPVGFRISG
jgi:hypothetical protein